MRMTECNCDTVCSFKNHYGDPKRDWELEHGTNGMKILSIKEIVESPMLTTFIKGFGSIKKATK